MQVQQPLSVVTPTLDGDVLSVLAQAEAAFTPGQVARVVQDASVEGIRKVLQRLAAQGIVDVERVGQAYTYRLNRDHLAAEHIIALVNQRRTLLSRIEQALAEWAVPPVYGAMFGSAARGEMRADSDIDLFLVRPGGADEDQWQEQVGEVAHAVSRWTGNDTRILQMTEVEARTGAAAGEPVLCSIADEALTVAGHPTWLRRQVRAKAPRLLPAPAPLTRHSVADAWLRPSSSPRLQPSSTNWPKRPRTSQMPT